MKDPSAAISEAVFLKVQAAAAIKAVIGDPVRLYDKVVDDPTYPFGRLGDDEINGDSNSCWDGWEAYVTIHLFSRHPATPRLQVKDLATLFTQALGDNASLIAPVGFHVSEVELVQSRTFMEADGVTAHGVIVFRYGVDDGT